MGSWGDRGGVDGNAYEFTDLLGVYRKLYYGEMDMTSPAGHLVVDLWEGYGAFSGGFATGTFPLTGAEADWEDCGLCVRVSDYDSGTGSFSDHYMAQGGSVTLSSINGQLTGSLSNVVLRHIVVSGSTSSNHPDGCTTMITSASFTELIITDP